jgi:hypothetical protein
MDGCDLPFAVPENNHAGFRGRSPAHGVELGKPTRFGVTLPFVGGRFYSYDVSNDGQRILALVPDTSENAPLTILMNWQAYLKP